MARHMTEKELNLPHPGTDLRTIIACCLERDTVVRSIKTALVIGTTPALINHGQDVLAGQFSLRWITRILVT